ncbi:S8 family serine peptidase [Pseudenhygromyxa sp. WMMC2535]|uniref:S8 family serine peptidase n=1 Tax=Pseudenhygromyxa sp. WMMC2535 TaxID=2712867 RepID=UPI00155293B6|nr:S8 family serine peptidase [Pseudenhygromyxa sp. WMMC2535]
MRHINNSVLHACSSKLGRSLGLAGSLATLVGCDPVDERPLDARSFELELEFSADADPREDAGELARAEAHIAAELARASERNFELRIDHHDGEREVERRGYGPRELAVAADPEELRPFVTGEDLEQLAGGPPQPARVITAEVEELLAQAEPDARVELIFNLETRTPMAYLPALIHTEARESVANQRILAARAEGIARVERLRAAELVDTIAALEAADARVLEHFTFGQALRVDVPAARVAELARRAEVLHVEPVQTELPPPGYISDGRELIASDLFVDAGYDGGGHYIGVLDTGVRSSHGVFQDPDRVAIERDCVNGTSTCGDKYDGTWNPDDDCWNHGTASIAILTGHSPLTDNYVGVSRAKVDSWKVYTCMTLDSAAVLRGFESAVLFGDAVILAEMQPIWGPTSSISMAADDAFDSGSAVIATNGNDGPSYYTVASPADAHKALGIGAYHIDTLAHLVEQSRGGTADYRYKPDLRAPTDSVSASTACDTCVASFTGTSGAAPYAAGAAMLIDDYLRDAGGSQPGLVYAAMINAGHRQSLSYTYGAGDLELDDPACHLLVQGSRNVSQGQKHIINFPVIPGDSQLEVTLWWPEGYTNHNDIRLEIEDSSGVTRGSAEIAFSVTQKVHVSGALAPTGGSWQAQLIGASVSGTQQVFYQIKLAHSSC